MNYLKHLKQISPFSILEEEVLKSILPNVESNVYKKGSFVFKQMEPSKKTLFLVVKGLAEIIITNEHGIENRVALRRQYEFFGETVLLTDKPYSASVRALEELHCLFISKDTFEILLEKSPDFASFFTQLLSERLRNLYDEVVHEQSYEAYSVDYQPFRKRVANIMTTRVITCNNNDSIYSLANSMRENLVSSLIVLDANSKIPVGLITESDLVLKVLAKYPRYEESKALTAKDIMNPNLVTLPPNAPFYQALLAMVKESVKHLVIVDNDQVVGIVTMRDLIKSRSTGALTIVSRIEAQTTIGGLAKVSGEVIHVLQAMVAEKASASEIFEVMTQFYDRITRKVIEISEDEMIREGRGKAPTEYCWLTMGSSGRKEQFLQTDQDNAIIYEDSSEEVSDIAEEYFSILAHKIVEGLYQCGFAKCKGDVMASNPQWCRTLISWRKITTKWVEELDGQSIRNLTIFLDFRPVHGKFSLANDLRQHVINLFKFAPITFHQLAIDDLDHKVPLGLFGQFIVEKKGSHKNEINLKNSVCIHIVDCIRLFALKEGLSETNTLLRLHQITEQSVIPKDDAEFIDAAYQTLMIFRIRENLRKILQGLEPNNYINPYNLSKREKAVLKEAFLAVSQLQSFTSSVFRVDEFGGF